MTQPKIPPNVQAILDRLERRTTQDFVEIESESESEAPLTRASSRPYDVLEGTIVVDEATFGEIKRVQVGLYTGTYRGTELTLAPISNRVVGRTLESGRLNFDLEIKMRVVRH